MWPERTSANNHLSIWFQNIPSQRVPWSVIFFAVGCTIKNVIRDREHVCLPWEKYIAYLLEIFVSSNMYCNIWSSGNIYCNISSSGNIYCNIPIHCNSYCIQYIAIYCTNIIDLELIWCDWNKVRWWIVLQYILQLFQVCPIYIAIFWSWAIYIAIVQYIAMCI